MATLFVAVATIKLMHIVAGDDLTVVANDNVAAAAYGCCGGSGYGCSRLWLGVTELLG